MPRPKVKDEDRKRVARACDTCKRRKEKCDGTHPCLLCRRRNREGECTYAFPRQRRGGGGSIGGGGGSISESSPSLQLGEALATSNNDAEIAIESLLTLSGTRSAPKTPAATGTVEVTYDNSLSHAPVPKLARLLRDGHGKFIFVGDSSNLAFLQNIRRLARTAIGESNLTTDPMRHAMIEAIPTERRPSTSSLSARSRPSRSEAEDLVNQYLLATCGVVDLFDRSDILQHLASWTEGNVPSSASTDAIFYLVLAIGARNCPDDLDDKSEIYFSRGRELAVSSFMEDPSILTVQSYILIAFYLLTACRRNGAFMLLGVAIRAAYALGLHRSDISMLFEARERKTRERVWKSLRVLDLFMSASLGRPPATSEVDGGNVSWEDKTRGYEDIRMGSLHSSAMLRICFIFERILNEVYCRREVDIILVNSISRQYRDWNMALDTGLDIDGFGEEQAALPSAIQAMLGMAHLKGSYYWSIILLTRPFLIFDVSNKISLEPQTVDQSPRAHAETSTLSEACVDAALRSIEIASDVVHTSGCPKRPILVTNSIFVSALVLGLAMFGDYDKSFPLMSSLEQAKLVLGIIAKNDPSGRRYFQIISNLQQAALEHIRQRDEKQLQKRRQGINSIFGNLLAQDASKQATTNKNDQGSNEAYRGIPLNIMSPPTSEKPSTPAPNKTETRRGPTLTTSGVLASNAKESTQQVPAVGESSYPLPNTFEMFNPMDMQGIDAMTLPQYAEEFPLFSLMNDFTEGDPFYEMLQ